MESIPQIVKSAEPRMDKAIEHFGAELTSLRTGRATTSMVEGVLVEQFGQMVPLKTVATIATPDAQTISINPWDKNMVAVIEKTLREDQALGLNPSSDGNVVRLNVPPMTEERRREIVKDLGTKIESCNIALRQIRHDVLNEVKRLEKAGDATQDDAKYAEQTLTKQIEAAKQRIDTIAKAKEAEIMTV